MNKAQVRLLIDKLQADIKETNRQIANLSEAFKLDEPEFTEYGFVRPPDQFHNHSLNRQEKYWLTKDGRWVSLAKMEPKHRENLLAHLERNAEGWQTQWLNEGTGFLTAQQLGVLSDGAWHGIQAELDQLEDERKIDPHIFLHRQPLWRRLAYDYLMSLDSWKP